MCYLKRAFPCARLLLFLSFQALGVRPRFEPADYTYVLTALHAACTTATAQPAAGAVADSRQQGAASTEGRPLSGAEVELAVAITNGLGRSIAIDSSRGYSLAARYSALLSTIGTNLLLL